MTSAKINDDNNSLGLREISLIVLAVVLVSFFFLYRSIFLNISGGGNIASGEALESGMLDAPDGPFGEVSEKIIESLTAPN